MKTHSDFGLHSFLRNLLVMVMLLLASACSETKKPATQVAAKVNNDEISVHQVNNALSQLPNVPVDSVDKVRKDILTKLVNQQLAVQQAVDQKIDRAPDVMMMLDTARRDILTRAYLSRLVAGLPKPTAEDAKKFYTSHPELFAQRRVYRLHEITLAPTNMPVTELRMLAASKTMEEIAAWLKKQNASYTAHVGTRPAEQIPLPALTILSQLKDGQTTVIQTPQSIDVVHVESSQLAPVDEATALKQIPKFLANEQAKMAIASELDRLKTKAKIVYLGEFASMAPVVAAKEAPVVADESTPPPPVSSIEKGIAGLK